MSEFESLQNSFLIAMPNFNDGYFDHSVTYICEHNEHGALGIVINRPMDVSVADMLSQLALEDVTANDGAVASGMRENDMTVSDEVAAIPVLGGGPVQPERGFVLHAVAGSTVDDAADVNDGDEVADPRLWEASMPVGEGIALTGSLDVLTAIAQGQGPSRYLIALGYAGWSAGQLENELADNAWLVARGNPDILFDLPYEERWAAAARSLGIDPAMISSQIGHA